MTTLTNELTIKNMSLRNRLVLPPITTNYGTSKGGYSISGCDEYYILIKYGNAIKINPEMIKM